MDQFRRPWWLEASYPRKRSISLTYSTIAWKSTSKMRVRTISGCQLWKMLALQGLTWVKIRIYLALQSSWFRRKPRQRKILKSDRLSRWSATRIEGLRAQWNLLWWISRVRRYCTPVSLSAMPYRALSQPSSALGRRAHQEKHTRWRLLSRHRAESTSSTYRLVCRRILATWPTGMRSRASGGRQASSTPQSRI